MEMSPALREALHRETYYLQNRREAGAQWRGYGGGLLGSEGLAAQVITRDQMTRQYPTWEFRVMSGTELAEEKMVAAAQARWARECEIQSRARAAEQARNPWSRNDYPGTD